MTEADWDRCTDPAAMLEFQRTSGRANERRLRLFAAACCRRIWPLLTDERSRRAVEMVERGAEGTASEAERIEAHWAAGLFRATSVAGYFAGNVVGYASGGEAGMWKTASSALDALSWTSPGDQADPGAEAGHQAALLRDLFGNPFRPPPALDRSLLTPAILALARAAYEERKLPEGTLDHRWLAALADVLAAAGCTDAGLLGHLRSPGPHVRGCHGLDAVLDKT